MEIGARTVSVCDVGDPVCDADADTDTDALSPAALAIHTSYAPALSGAHAWGAPLYQLVMSAAPTSTTVPDSTTEPDSTMVPDSTTALATHG
jgi:hypothetical protein